MKGRIKFELKNKSGQKTKQVLSKDLEQRLLELPTGAAVVLGIIGIAGLTTMIAFAPNSVRLFNLFLKRKSGKHYSKAATEQKLLHTVYYLKKTGKIKISEENGILSIILGKLGKQDTKKLQLDTLAVPKASAWDGSVWLAAADIPTKTHRGAADAFRSKIKQLGFYPLQRTLWIHPYNPRKELQYLLDYFDIGRFVTLLHVDKLDPQDLEVAKVFWQQKGVL